MKDIERLGAGIDIGITPLLYKVAHKCNIILSEELKEFSISLPQIAVLSVLCIFDDEEINQKVLSNVMMVRESSISSITKNMIKSGFITKQQSKTDGRNQTLEVTEKGRYIFDKVKVEYNFIENKIYAGLSDSEKKNLKDILKKIV